MFNQKLEIMYEIRKTYLDTKAEDDVIISFPMTHSDDIPSHLKWNGYGIYENKPDGTQEHITDYPVKRLSDCIVQYMQLVQDNMKPKHVPRRIPEPNGDRNQRIAALMVMDEIKESIAHNGEMAEARSVTDDPDNVWLAWVSLIRTELNEMSAKTLREWIEDDHYPI